VNKYRAVKTQVDDITFDSKAEARRYSELKIRERAGEITQLALQPPFPIVVNGQKIGVYRADFSYFESKSGGRVVEDVKGYSTPIFRLKKKLVEALYDRVKIMEIKT
jgi:hypothetical protein